MNSFCESSPPTRKKTTFELGVETMLSRVSSRCGKRCLRFIQRRSNQSAAAAEFEEPKSPSQILNRYDYEDAFLLNDQLTEDEIMVKVRLMFSVHECSHSYS